MVSSDKCPNYSVHYRSCKNHFPIRRCLIAQTFINCKLVPNPYQDRISLHDFQQQLIQIPSQLLFFPFLPPFSNLDCWSFPHFVFVAKVGLELKFCSYVHKKTLHTNNVNNLGDNKANQNMGTFIQGCPIPKGREFFKGKSLKLRQGRLQ